MRKSLSLWLQQTYPNKELLIIDDGQGEESCLDIVQSFNHPRVRHIVWPNKISIGRKRNIGVEFAHGDIIAHWDDDDWYSSNRLTEQYRQLLSWNVGLVGYHTVDFYNRDLDKAYRYYEDPTCLVGSSFMFQKAAWRAVRFPDVSIGEDTYFMRRVSTLAGFSGAGMMVAMDHAGNTNKRDCDSFIARYGAIPVEPVKTLLASTEKQESSILLACISWNTKDVTVEAIEALKVEAERLRAIGNTVHIAVVDNGSKDGTPQALKKLSGIKVFCNKTNKGSSVARNQLIDYGKKNGVQFLFFQDGDIEVIPFSVVALKRYLDKAPPTTGCVGFASCFCTRNRNEATAILEDCADLKSEYTPSLAWTQYGLFRASVFDKIRFITDAPFDGAGWGFEDDALALDMTIAGLSIVRLEGVKYLHRNIQSSVWNMKQDGINPAEVYEKRRDTFLKYFAGRGIDKYLNPYQVMRFTDISSAATK